MQRDRWSRVSICSHLGCSRPDRLSCGAHGSELDCDVWRRPFSCKDPEGMIPRSLHPRIAIRLLVASAVYGAVKWVKIH